VTDLARTPPVTRLGWATYALAAVVIALDQLSKYLILKVLFLPHVGQVKVLPFFNLTMVWNQGVSFGFLRAEQDLARWGLVGFSLIVAIGLAVWARRTTEPLRCAALGLIIGGAIGNMIDRINFAAVVDFLDFSALHFPWVFNVADSGITVGVILLLLESFLAKPKT
jgi:signal peptidase II